MNERPAPGRTELPGGSPAASVDPPAIPPAWPAFESSPWWRRLAAAPRSVLLLDYDGTLAPFVRDRLRATTWDGVPERLFRLVSLSRLRLVLISGRPARELSSLLPRGLNVEIWGSHGRERLHPDGGYTAVPLRPTQQQCLDRLEATLHQHALGYVIEKKVGSVALHTRGLHSDESRQVIELARNFSCSPETPEGSGLEWLPFDGGLELRGTGCTKATAVFSILRDERPNTPAAYLGDDLTDEDAFVALRECGSPSLCLPVLVRPESRPSVAGLWLRPPDELLAFLDRWLLAASRPEDPE